jgi:copper chaperone NosL
MISASVGSLLLVIAVISAAFSATAGEGQPPLPSPRDKCPVCGMFVARYPDWTAQATFADGSTLFFDGPKDLFKFLLDPDRYLPGTRRAAVRSVWVKDYYTLSSINARNAYFAVGSELVPFRERKDAEQFLKDHQGERILRFNEITGEVIATLD